MFRRQLLRTRNGTSFSFVPHKRLQPTIHILPSNHNDCNINNYNYNTVSCRYFGVFEDAWRDAKKQAEAAQQSRLENKAKEYEARLKGAANTNANDNDNNNEENNDEFENNDDNENEDNNESDNDNNENENDNNEENEDSDKQMKSRSNITTESFGSKSQSNSKSSKSKVNVKSESEKIYNEAKSSWQKDREAIMAHREQLEAMKKGGVVSPAFRRALHSTGGIYFCGLSYVLSKFVIYNQLIKYSMIIGNGYISYFLYNSIVFNYISNPIFLSLCIFSIANGMYWNKVSALHGGRSFLLGNAVTETLSLAGVASAKYYGGLNLMLIALFYLNVFLYYLYCKFNGTYRTNFANQCFVTNDKYARKAFLFADKTMPDMCDDFIKQFNNDAGNDDVDSNVNVNDDDDRINRGKNRMANVNVNDSDDDQFDTNVININDGRNVNVNDSNAKTATSIVASAAVSDVAGVASAGGSEYRRRRVGDFDVAALTFDDMKSNGDGQIILLNYAMNRAGIKFHPSVVPQSGM